MSSKIPIPRYSRWPARLSWLVILSLAAFIVYRNGQAKSATDAVDADGITVDDIRIRLMGEELIGVRSMGALIGSSQTVKLDENQDRMVRQLDDSVRSLSGRFHVSIIAGEILGKDQALTRLDSLTKESAVNPELAADIAALRAIYSSSGSALDSAARERLLQRHDYFARVALAYGVPADVEPRKTVEAGGVHATIMLGFVALILLLLLLGAVGFFIAAIVLKVKGRLRRMYVADPSANTAYLEGFAIYFVLFIVGFGLLRQYFHWVDLQWEWLAWLIIPIVMLWFIRRGATSKELRDALGWHTGKGVLREIGAGIAGYLAGLVVVVVGFFLTYLLIQRTGLSPEHPMMRMLQGDRWHVLALYGLASVFAPVMEETMFRGALFHHLRRRWGWAVSAPVVAFIFAIIHPQGWVAVPVLGSVAIVLAALREWRGSIIAPMVAHACSNFIVLTLALAVLR